MSSLSLEEFNDLPASGVEPLLLKCCGSDSWAQKLIASRPFRSIDHLIEASVSIWNSLSRYDWREAFQQHPMIGDLNSLRKKYPNTLDLAASEQSGTAGATEKVLSELADYNRQYFEKFGFIFIICATGKSAAEMLTSLKSRINNSVDQEILVASNEQIKITCIRLNKLIK